MSATDTASWLEANQRYLMAEVRRLRALLDAYTARRAGDLPDADPVTNESDEYQPIRSDMPAPPALERIASIFGLSRFERDILLLCAAAELDGSFAAAIASAQGDPRMTYPTFGLALAVLPGAHWSALTPQAPLRHWLLIETGSGSSLTSAPLTITERVLHELAGVPCPEPRLAGLVTPWSRSAELVPSHADVASRIARAWNREQPAGLAPVIQLCGTRGDEQVDIAALAAAETGAVLLRLQPALLPVVPSEVEILVRLLERELALSDGVLVLECHDPPESAGQTSALDHLIERVAGRIIIVSREPRHVRERPSVTIHVDRPTPAEQHALWRGALGPAAGRVNGRVETLVDQFNLSPHAIQSAALEALTHTPAGDDLSLEDMLWEAGRSQSRPRLEDLAQRIEARVSWDDLVVPETQAGVLREIALHVQRRSLVYDDWGFADKGSRGLGISALFAGASGTGKTTAAEVLANELRLDLYRIDLSSVVSKYIGETEKNLRRIFDAAEEGGAILLFDEADALFGKRSEVKDSHDRYANVEVSYLLQRMETYRGLAILTTNMRSALDPAFLRRIRFVVTFPFPDAAQRAEIWRRVFPRQTPTVELDYTRLAQLNIAGGNIRNIALNAAFLAASDSRDVTMSHILQAARGEYMKIEKHLTESEIQGWPTIGERE